MVRFFADAWNGRLSLAKAFWIVYFIFGLILGLIISFIFSLFISNFFTNEVYNQYSNLVITIGFPYTLFSAICVWRCANKSAFFWKILARLIVSIAVISGVMSILYVVRIF